jgi:Peptidase inhibitor family I36
LKRILAATATAIAMSSMVATPAGATSRDGNCDDLEFCLYYYGSETGSLSDFIGNVPDFAGKTFISSGTGQGAPVKNNAESAKFRGISYAIVYYNSQYGYGAGWDAFAGPSGQGNLVHTWNQNAAWQRCPTADPECTP